MTHKSLSKWMASPCEAMNRTTPKSPEIERAFHIKQQLSLSWIQTVFGTALVLGSLSVSTLQAAQIVASPEGTATTYVSKEGPLVFAPRAARAQKVIFDTPEKQLIYAPDTPFRRFFDSHAYDFDSAGLEYAKTTILGDIVNRLRSREYIRDIVGQVIEDYRDQAISGATFAEQWNYVRDGWILFTNRLTNSLTGTTNQGGVATGRVSETASEVSGITNRQSNLFVNAQGTGLPRQLQQQLKILAEMASSHPDLFVREAELKITSAEGLEGPNLTQIIQLLDPALRQPLTNATAISDSTRDKWRRQRAELLRDAYYSIILQANYPNMEDEEIDQLIDNLYAGYRPLAAGHLWNASQSQRTQSHENRTARAPQAARLVAAGG